MQKPSLPDSSKFDLKTEPDNSSQPIVEPSTTSKFDQLKTKISSQSAKLITFAKAKGPLPFVIAGTALLAIVTIIILAAVYHHPSADVDNQNPGEAQSPDDNQETSNDQSSISPGDQPDTKVPVFIDLQPTVNAWLKTTPANVGLMIYDLDNNRVAASHQPNQVFNVASIYKLFFVYDGYRQIESGDAKANEKYVTTSDYRANTYTYGECLDLMIRESYNGCADKMHSDRQAFARVANLIDELNLNNTTNGGLSSTAADLTELLKLYYEHPDLSEENWQKIADSMLSQPPTKIDATTTYNWRQGLPSGFSNQAKVYDKVGWAWNPENYLWSTYAAAAIIEFPEQNRHYTVVVLTSNLPGRTAAAITNLGARIEDAILSADNSL